MTRREYSRANGRNEGVDFDEKRRVRPLIWRAIRCLIVVAKSVARDIVDEFWRKVSFFFLKKVETFIDRTSRIVEYQLRGTNSIRRGSIASKGEESRNN